MRLNKRKKPIIEQWYERAIPSVSGLGKAWLGKDNRLYRQTQGIVEMIVPVEPEEGTTPITKLVNVQWDKYPNMGELTHLYRAFLRRHTTEVLVMVGWRWETGKFVYVVPQQQVAPDRVDWHDPAGMAWMDGFARYVGTVHIHPGASALPSPLDVEYWKNRDASGLHTIIGRTGEYTITGSVAGYCMPLASGSIANCAPQKTAILGAQRKPMRELIVPMPSDVGPSGEGVTNAKV